jgi:hypothetical protein
VTYSVPQFNPVLPRDMVPILNEVRYEKARALYAWRMDTTIKMAIADKHGCWDYVPTKGMT